MPTKNVYVKPRKQSTATMKYNPNCPNKNCIGGVITFNGATGRPCLKCNPKPKKK